MTIDLAVIGMSLDFAAGKNYHLFWDNLEKNKNMVTNIPENRFDLTRFYGEEENQTLAKYGGFIKDLYEFDAGFFNMTPI